MPPPPPATHAAQRLQTITSHIHAPRTATTTTTTTANMATALPKDPITCHVLDTTTGRPAPNIAVRLTCLSQSETTFSSTTDSDGRIANWAHPSIADAGGVAKAISRIIQANAEEGDDNAAIPKGATLWTLQFKTGEYYGAANTFFPLVELTFLVKEGEHFHVPLLLGPYSFTTYRGS